MKIPELFEQKKPVFSLEIFPPKKKANIDTIYDTVAKLAECNPDFISVTYGAGGNLADNSTCEIASNIKKKYGIETAVVCSLSSRQMKKVKFALRLNVEEHFLCRVLIILIVLF